MEFLNTDPSFTQNILGLPFVHIVEPIINYN